MHYGSPYSYGSLLIKSMRAKGTETVSGVGEDSEATPGLLSGGRLSLLRVIKRHIKFWGNEGRDLQDGQRSLAGGYHGVSICLIEHIRSNRIPGIMVFACNPRTQEVWTGSHPT